MHPQEVTDGSHPSAREGIQRSGGWFRQASAGRRDLSLRGAAMWICRRPAAAGRLMDGLPENTPPSDMLMLDLPDQAAATAFDHVMMNWNPQGHDPVVLFGKPHFDFHFDMADMPTLQSIDPSDPDYAAKADHLPDAKYVPQDYVVPPGGSAAEQAVPGMGVHLVDSSDTSLVPGSYNFQQIVINGTWDGRYTFVEPMVTRDWLLTKPTLEQQPLKQPQAYQKKAYYPTTYSGRFDEQAKEYVIAVGGMTMREPS